MPEISNPTCVMVFSPGAASTGWCVVFSKCHCGVVRTAMGQ